MSAVADLIIRHKPSLFQAVLRKRLDCEFLVQSLEETDRGDGGFGSTDV